MKLQEFFEKNSKVALAFSGGTDSAYLLYEATRYGADVHAYYVKSDFQPQFELEDAMRLSEALEASVTVIPLDVLTEDRVKQNPSDRCYFCKKRIFSSIVERAKKDGYEILLDGTNASDRVEERPGMKALEELQVRSPLRECGLTKEEVRKNSKEAGLFTWNKPAYACLATRIPTGREITKELLEKTEAAEKELFSMGYKDFRIRFLGDVARIQIPESQMQELLCHRTQLVEKLKKYYSGVVLDLEGRDG